MINNPWPVFFALLIGHALCDYPLQGDFLARAKNHSKPIPGVPWYQALAAHAAIHAGAVWLITGSGELAAFEFVCHAAIDYAKCRQQSYHAGVLADSYNVDQFLHVACKLGWVVLLFAGLA